MDLDPPCSKSLSALPRSHPSLKIWTSTATYKKNAYAVSENQAFKLDWTDSLCVRHLSRILEDITSHEQFCINSKSAESMVNLAGVLGTLTFLVMVFIMNQRNFHSFVLSTLAPKSSVISVLQVQCFPSWRRQDYAQTAAWPCGKATWCNFGRWKLLTCDGVCGPGEHDESATECEPLLCPLGLVSCLKGTGCYCHI